MITSTSNAQVKHLLQLQKKSKVRNEEKVFVVEGIRMFVEVPEERVEKVYVSESFYNKKKGEIDFAKYSTEILSSAEGLALPALIEPNSYSRLEMDLLIFSSNAFVSIFIVKSSCFVM